MNVNMIQISYHRTVIKNFKGAHLGLRQFLATESSLKMMKNAFYLTLKALFVLKIFCLDFLVMRKNSLIRKINLISKFVTLQFPLHLRDYLKKTSIKINVATDEGNSRNEVGH